MANFVDKPKILELFLLNILTVFRGPCGCNTLYELRAYHDSNTRQSQDNTLIIPRLWSNLDQTSNHII